MLGSLIGGLVIGSAVVDVVDKIQTKQDYYKKIEFYDLFRSLDYKLASFVGENFKGVTYLIKGLKVTRSGYDLMNVLYSIKDYRGKLSHDRRRWREIKSPSEALITLLKYTINMVDEDEDMFYHFVRIGYNAFN